MNKLMTAAAIILTLGLAASVGFNLFLYAQNQNQLTTNRSLNQQISSLTAQTANLTTETNNLTQQINSLIMQQQNSAFNGTNYEAAEYYNEFGAIPRTNVNASFTPPISMYHALQIGLEYDGWNKTSLQNMTLSAYLTPWFTYSNSTGSGSGVPGNYTSSGLTSPPANYDDVYDNGVTYRYVWEISIEKSGEGFSIPPWDFMLVDAATGVIVPTGPLF